MARTITENDRKFFGALGVKDPVCTVPQVTFGRAIDFSVTPVEGGSAGKSYALLPLPAGFFVTNVAVVQTGVCSADATVTVGPKSDASKTLATASVVDDTDGVEYPRVAAVSNVANGFLAAAAADTVCITVPQGKTLDMGGIEVFVTGIHTLADTYKAAPEDAEPWRDTLQTQDNVSGGQVDPRKYEGPAES